MVVTLSNGVETFTFAPGMIEKVSSDILTELDQNVMPSSGPMSNQGFDNSGVTKVITLQGDLFDTPLSVVSGGDNNIRSKKIMKYWLEALQNGFQTEPTLFTSEFEVWSISEGFGTSVMADDISGTDVELNATFVNTKVYKSKLTIDEEAGSPEKIPFTLDLWVAGI